MPQPIKRSPALMPLSREHHFDLLLVWKLRQGLAKGVEPARMAAYVNYLYEGMIDTHFSDEEQFFFDQLPAGDPQAEEARKQHAELRQTIDLAADPQKATPELFERLADLLEAHVRYEERELFAYLEKTLSPDVLSKAQSVIEERHQGFEDSWQDIFWSK